MKKYTPRYVIDHAALARLRIPFPVVDFLSKFLEDPNFRLESVCRHCETWDRGKPGLLESAQSAPAQSAKPLSLTDKPAIPGALSPTEGCDGCWFSYLDPVSDLLEETDAGHVEMLIDKIEDALLTMDNERRISEARARLMELRMVLAEYHERPREGIHNGRRRRTLVLALPIAASIPAPGTLPGRVGKDKRPE